MSMTTEEAADLLGVSPGLVRKWVQRGRLRPIVPAARPLRFDDDDVIALELRVRSAAERAATERARRAYCDT